MATGAPTVVDIDKLIGEGRDGEAEGYLREVLRQRPHDVGALVHYARLAAKRREFRAAQEFAAKALGQAPARCAVFGISPRSTMK